MRRIATTAALLYVALTSLLVALEPHLVYQPFAGPSDPVKAGLPHFTRRTLAHAGLPPITYWENNAERNAPTVLYFHGNAGGLHKHTTLPDFLDKAGMRVVAMEYPSYPDAEGKPSEATIIAQAKVLWQAKVPNPQKPAVIWGYSLGSGIATQLAATHTPAALVLEAPFTAVVDRAAELFPILPVRRLMKNQYRSRDVIADINAPLFIMHGNADMIIPIHHGRDLFALANEPKTFKEYAGFGHLDLHTSTAYTDALAFIRTHQR